MLYTYSVYVYIDGVCFTYLDDGCYISGQVLHIWTMNVIYLDDCCTSGRSRLHIWTGVTYLDDDCYMSGRLLHIWTMEVTYLDDCYMAGRRRLYMSWRLLHIWTMEVTYLDDCYIHRPPKVWHNLEHRRHAGVLISIFGILTVYDNHKLGLFCHHKLIDVHELRIWCESQGQ